MNAIKTVGVGLGLVGVVLGTYGLVKWLSGTASLSGTVRDGITLEPMQGVNLKMRIAGLSDVWTHFAITDLNGAYLIEDLSPDAWNIAFEKDGYSSVQTQLNLSGGQNEYNPSMMPGAGITLNEGWNLFVYTGYAIAATDYLGSIWDCIITAYYLYDGAWYPITSAHTIENNWHIAIEITSDCAGMVLPSAELWEVTPPGQFVTHLFPPIIRLE